MARDDIQRVALAGDADHARRAPAHARRFDGLAHDRDVAGGLEGEVRAVAPRLLEHALHDICSAGPSIGGSVVTRELEALLGQVDRDDATGSLEACPDDGSETDHPE